MGLLAAESPPCSGIDYSQWDAGLHLLKCWLVDTINYPGRNNVPHEAHVQGYQTLEERG